MRGIKRIPQNNIMPEVLIKLSELDIEKCANFKGQGR